MPVLRKWDLLEYFKKTLGLRHGLYWLRMEFYGYAF
jgi:hypothetical protein